VTRFRVLLVHSVALAIILWGMRRTGERPQALFYAIFVDYGLRLLTIETMARVLRGEWLPALAPAVPYLSSRPEPGRQSYPVRWGDNGPAAGLSAYLLVMTFVAALAFVLMHVNADQELDVDFATVLRDLGGGVLFGALYWLESLAARSILVDPSASRPVNFGYNSREMTVLALSLLAGAVVVVVRQGMDLPASGWAVAGPLLAWRFLFDVTLGLQLVKSEVRREK
jgi:hypothetical protein